MTALLAELTALHAHVVALNDKLAPRGFTMASDTRMKLDRAAALIADANPANAGWQTEAVTLAEALRREAGQSEAP